MSNQMEMMAAARSQLEGKYFSDDAIFYRLSVVTHGLKSSGMIADSCRTNSDISQRCAQTARNLMGIKDSDQFYS